MLPKYRAKYQTKSGWLFQAQYLLLLSSMQMAFDFDVRLFIVFTNSTDHAMSRQREGTIYYQVAPLNVTRFWVTKCQIPKLNVTPLRVTKCRNVPWRWHSGSKSSGIAFDFLCYQLLFVEFRCVFQRTNVLQGNEGHRRDARQHQLRWRRTRRDRSPGSAGFGSGALGR